MHIGSILKRDSAIRKTVPTTKLVCKLFQTTWTTAVPRRHFLAWFTTIGVVALGSFIPSTGLAAGSTSGGIDELAGKLEAEKSMAVSFVLILNSYNANNIELNKAIGLYAEAKAAFDGLITQLEVELIQSRPPNQSEAFNAKLNEAVDKRRVLVSFVNDKLISHTEGVQKGIVDAFIKGSGELIKDLTEAGLSMWREYRSTSEENRKEMMQLLESLRWPQFTFTGGR